MPENMLKNIFSGIFISGNVEKEIIQHKSQLKM